MAPTLQSFVHSFNNKLEAPVRQHLKNVYGCLSLSTVSAAVGAYIHMYTGILEAGLLTTLGALGLLFALISTPDNDKNQKLRLGYLLGFAFLSGLGMGPLLEAVIFVDPSIIVTALVGTTVMFVSFSISAILAERGRWLYFGGTLMTMLNAILLISLANLFLRSPVVHQIHLYLGLFVMSGFVLYDTQLIIEKRRMGSKDFIAHSLDLFIDFIGVFRRLLIILTQKEQQNRKRKD
ncbi:probable Bax inhibitor 1 [Neodiprion virginianus]|uniref:probable Bax inhibitor 1 n=1 Tax=Neodiprion fabricii TaxID=2872261 RepID=UPI001ED96E8A|nr:probable Bax inhibitor 1 [Neodiprion fabricii]XP_046616878.1 probable Bax inhibitor 1 [Neodiprion virginianus]